MSFKITKPVRLIETFSGLGSFSMALRDLGVDFQTWRTSDWDVNSVKSFKAIHHPDDKTDYSSGFSREEIVNLLDKMQVSLDGKEPLPIEKIRKKNESWLREVYNAFKASNNMGSITHVHAEDLGIERGGDANENEYTYILSYSFP